MTLLILGASKNKPKIDWSFLGGSLPSGLTFSRAQSAPGTTTAYGPAGALKYYNADQPRFDYDPVTLLPRGLLIEESRTNAFLNSGAPVTQGIAVTAQAYTLSFYGTGTITISGAYSGTLPGGGAFPSRANMTFTPSAGTLTLTLSGSVSCPQLEVGGFATSYIPTGASATARALEQVSISSPIWLNASQGAFAVEYDIASFGTYPAVLGGAPNCGFNINNGFAQWYNSSSNVYTANSVPVAAVRKEAFSYTSNSRALCLNGGAVAADSNVPWNTLPTSFKLGCSTNNNQFINGHVRRLRYWNFAMPASILQKVTT